MRNIRKFSPALIAAIALIFSFSTLSFGKSKNVKFPNVKIKNFGQMDDRFFRGARPDENDYPALAALGVQTIIDLTDNSREYEQPKDDVAQPMVEEEAQPRSGQSLEPADHLHECGEETLPLFAS